MGYVGRVRLNGALYCICITVYGSYRFGKVAFVGIHRRSLEIPYGNGESGMTGFLTAKRRTWEWLDVALFIWLIKNVWSLCIIIPAKSGCLLLPWGLKGV